MLLTRRVRCRRSCLRACIGLPARIPAADFCGIARDVRYGERRASALPEGRGGLVEHEQRHLSRERDALVRAHAAWCVRLP